jgi:hypothetical protein
MTTKIAESTAYENCIGVKEEVNNSDLSGFIDIEDDDSDESWKKHWTGMPEFEQEDNPAYKKLIVSFRNKEDYDEFAKLIEQTLTEKTKTIWHPKLDREANSLMRWIEEE